MGPPTGDINTDLIAGLLGLLGLGLVGMAWWNGKGKRHTASPPKDAPKQPEEAAEIKNFIPCGEIAEFAARNPGSTAAPLKRAVLDLPAPTVKHATALAGTAMIERMMGIPAKDLSPKIEYTSPSEQSWYPRVEVNKSWKWENGHWHFRVSDNWDDLTLGREGSAPIHDGNWDSYLARNHAILHKFSDPDGKVYSITARDGDVSIYRDGGIIFLKSERQDYEWLVAGDIIYLTQDIFFVWDPQT